jgi:Flp pilus assembly protein TadG
MVAVLVAVCLTVLLSFVAIAVDGGMLLDSRRRVQAAADAAAMAAVEDLYLNWRTNQGLDPDGTAAAKAMDNAAANGFTNVVVNIPPQSGYFTGKAGYAEVIVTYNQPSARSGGPPPCP